MTDHADIDHTGLTGVGGSLTVEEVDGSPTDSAVTKLVFPNGTLGITSHIATYTPAGGGGGSGAPYLPLDAAAAAGIGSGDDFSGTTLDGGWSDLQSTAVTSKDRSIDGYLILKNTGNTSSQMRGIKRAFAPAGDFTVWTKVPWSRFLGSAATFGIFVGATDASDGAGGNRVQFMWYGNTPTDYNWGLDKYIAGSRTSVFGPGSTDSDAKGPQWPLWIGIRRVGTTISCLWSFSGVNWRTVSTTTTISFTVATCGLFINENSGGSEDVYTEFDYIATAG